MTQFTQDKIHQAREFLPLVAILCGNSNPAPAEQGTRNNRVTKQGTRI